MKIIEILLISIGVAMDAFAVSICKGLVIKEMKLKKAFLVGIYFGFFQGIMPIVGYMIGNKFKLKLIYINYIFAFFILTSVGINMLKEGIFNKEEKEENESLKFKNMITLALATSIDALAVGISFAYLNVSIYLSGLYIGIITFIISTIGVEIGNKFGKKYKRKAIILGGIILLFMGIKMLIKYVF